MSVMVGGVTESLTADEAFVQSLNATVDDARVQVAYTLSFLVGLFQVQNSYPLSVWLTLRPLPILPSLAVPMASVFPDFPWLPNRWGWAWYTSASWSPTCQSLWFAAIPRLHLCKSSSHSSSMCLASN